MANILVADDSPVVRTWLAKLLPAMGHAVAGTAPNGMEALRLAASLRPDLVLMDVCMPGDMDGLTAGDRIGSVLNIPVVYMTAHTDEAVLGRIENAAPPGFVIKPLQPAQLRLTLEIALRTTAEKALAAANARLERLLVEDRLRRDLENADAASRAKSELLARVSHELRTPLNSILGMCEVLSEARLDPTHRNCIETINQSGETLLRLIDDVLDISRMDSGRMSLHNIPFEPARLLRETAEAIAPLAAKKALRLHVRMDPNLPDTTLGDPLALRRILGNLADNAVKFTERGEVELIAELVSPGSDADRLFFRVRDTGVGVDPRDHQAIFEPFATAPGSERVRSGAGLGLAVASKLAGLLGGQILLESRPGFGSLFTLDLPLKRHPSAAAEAPLALPCGVSNPEEPAGASPQAACASGTTDTTTQRILVAEDNQGNRDVISLFLKGSPFTADMAVNGAEAVERFRPGTYAAVLMDIDMPVMDGFAATREIRRLETEAGAPPTPIIVLTAHDLPEFRRIMIEAGCTDFLVKPVRKARLFEALPHNGPKHSAFIEVEAGHDPPPPEVVRLLPVFFSIQTRNLDKMRHALAQNDLDILRIMGHGLRGSALTYGVESMAELGATIEKAAMRGDTTVMNVLLDRLGETIVLESARGRTMA